MFFLWTVMAVVPSGPVAHASLRTPSEDQVRSESAPGPRSVDRPKKTRPRRVFEFCPVDPPRRYIDDFGHARYSGGYHAHEGIDIFARHGTPIRAPFDGVAKTSTSWAGGVQVYVHGRRGFVFNSHLSKAGKMGRVRAGTIVGYVGDSGNARGASPHDHFEWHPDDGPAVNPFKLLKAACRARPRPKPVKLLLERLYRVA
jgi:murein DD-endopeptidase MepM/ murein hydrolase activator NlpD